ncbi:hypothetical protein F4009_22565 [Candidatus Poribacteria bacterium]|nr:hypothetical protein [Candidatus Poribacteria bacterium]MYH79239.1 hypothetical protein [Candidatus Poribacteria bacterium]MYK96742.1 hypothetical protein [Candidatus Poribacteria bacterium]
MKNIMEMDPIETLELLNILVNDQIFAARERLIVLLNEPPSAENRRALETEFREFYCGYESLAFFLETYEEDPLEGLPPHTSLSKKLKRQREYILANRKTTLDERISRRAGAYMHSDPMPEKKISELPTDEYRKLLRMLVSLELFSLQERFLALLERNVPLAELDVAFREFFVAYELLELALEAYHYDPDEGLEMRPEFLKELDQRIADYEDGKAKLIPADEVFKKLGID